MYLIVLRCLYPDTHQPPQSHDVPYYHNTRIIAAASTKTHSPLGNISFSLNIHIISRSIPHITSTFNLRRNPSESHNDAECVATPQPSPKGKMPSLRHARQTLCVIITGNDEVQGRGNCRNLAKGTALQTRLAELSKYCGGNLGYFMV